MIQIEEEKLAKEESRTPERRLIPVLYRDCKKPAFLQPIHHIKITDHDYENGFKLLADTILGVSKKPPLKQEIKPPVTPETGVPRRIYTLALLKSLLPGQFDEVVFIYNMPSAHLPTNVAQVQKAISLINYAEQREGEDVSELLNTIFKVAPHLTRGC